MLTYLSSVALLAVTLQTPTAAPAEPLQGVKLSQESKALVRCSAAFAMIAHGQSIRNEAALKWPALDERGREFFVRSLAQLMDETGLDRAGISALVGTEAQRLSDAGEIEQAMPSCLILLDASGV